MEKHGQHRWPLSFTLDDGNNYKQQIVESKPVILKAFPRVSRICFQSDDDGTALQAADVLSWAVRRNLSATFAHGFEPLKDLFDQHHLNLEYKDEWMKGVADKIKGAESVDSSFGVTRV